MRAQCYDTIVAFCHTHTRSTIITAMVVLLDTVGVASKKLSSQMLNSQESVSTLTSDESNEDKCITIGIIASALDRNNQFSNKTTQSMSK